MHDTLKIGDVARREGVEVDTVRFYERRGLLPPPARRPSGYRAYDDEAVERIRFVKRLQRLGLTLEEVARLLRAVDEGATCESEQRTLVNALTRVDARLAELLALREALARAVDTCRAGECRLLEAAPTPR
jgi:MerR family copper efflux transcriptional regulator